MSFTYPAFLFALSAIAIPIIIHLFNFRKFKTIYFSDVRFLKEVKEETQAKSKLKHLLVLFARILTIVFLVLAFAQPFIPTENKKINLGEKAISIFIDNSFSMEAINKNGTLLDEAKKRAKEIVAAYKNTDRFQLLSNDFEGRHQRLVNKDDFLELLDEIKTSPVNRNLSEIVARQSDLLQQSNNQEKIAFILSDFQKSYTDFEKIKNDTSTTFNLVQLNAEKRDNIYIDTCWFETPIRQYNQVEKLHIRIKNNSDKTLENNSIKLFINNVQKTPASFSVEGNNETEVILSFVSKEIGTQHARIELNDYPISFDDNFYFSFQVAKNIPILTINNAETTDANNALNRLFGKDSLFILDNVQENKLDYSTLSTYRLIVLNELKAISSGLADELKRFMTNGGSVLVFPNKEIDVTSYKTFCLSLKANYYEFLDTVNTKVDHINTEHEIYKDVFDKKTFTLSNLDLPKVNTHYSLSKTTRSNQEFILKLQNGDAFLSKHSVEKGKLYLSSVSLNNEFSNFTKHALFVPTLYKIAMYSQISQPLFYTIGKEETVMCDNILSGENVFHIKNIENTFDIIPEHKSINQKTEIFLHDQITTANNYNLIANKNIIDRISFNFDRKESDLSTFPNDEMIVKINNFNLLNFKQLKISTKSATETIIETEEGKKLWKLCVILALLFLSVEIALLRFMK